LRLRTILVIVCLAISTIPIGIIGGIQGFQSESFILIGLIFLVTFFVSFTISHFIAKPIEKLTENIDKISKGRLDVDLESSEINEINNLVNSLNRVMASLKLAVYKVGIKKGEIFENVVKSNKKSGLIGLDEKKGEFKPTTFDQNLVNEKVSEKEFDSVFLFDENANIIDCNENLVKNLGYANKNEVLSLNISDIDLLENKNDLKEKIKQAKKEGAYNFKTIYKRKDGTSILVYEKLKYLKDKNTYKAIIKKD
jgi:PAS domain S-box-containing protein